MNKYNIDDAVFSEAFLDIYGKWRTGYYQSSKGLLLIKDMALSHIHNALNNLIRSREQRLAAIINLNKECPNDILLNIIEMYSLEEDLASLKIKEFQEELKLREKEL